MYSKNKLTRNHKETQTIFDWSDNDRLDSEEDSSGPGKHETFVTSSNKKKKALSWSRTLIEDYNLTVYTYLGLGKVCDGVGVFL